MLFFGGEKVPDLVVFGLTCGEKFYVGSLLFGTFVRRARSVGLVTMSAVYVLGLSASQLSRRLAGILLKATLDFDTGILLRLL